MADWNLPILTSTYTNVLDFLKNRDTDNATMFAAGGETNIPTNAVKWSSASNKFQKWTGSWVDLTAQYAIDVASVDGLGSTHILRKDNVVQSALGDYTFSNNVNFTGTWKIGGVTIGATAAEINAVCDGGSPDLSVPIADLDQLVVNDNGTMKQTRFSDLKTYILNAVYPVGSIYASRVNTSPATTIGGTWTAIREGRVLLSETGSSPYAVGTKSGSKDAILKSHYHTADGNLTTAWQGNHSHTAHAGGTSVVGGAFQYGSSNGADRSTSNPTGLDGGHSHDVTGNTSTDGESPTDKNLQPYEAVYMWARTA